jgi:hypothetical protein
LRIPSYEEIDVSRKTKTGQTLVAPYNNQVDARPHPDLLPQEKEQRRRVQVARVAGVRLTAWGIF